MEEISQEEWAARQKETDDALLRDTFAAAALAAVYKDAHSSESVDDIANRAYNMADAMMRARNRKPVE